MAFMLGKHLVFIDSFQFMSSSLERLVANLPEGSFKYTREEFKYDNKFKLITSKGVYPYDKFNEIRLPSKDNFFSIINMLKMCRIHLIKKIWDSVMICI